MEKQSLFLRLRELGGSGHGGRIRAMIAAAIGVLSGMLPYCAAALIIIALLGGKYRRELCKMLCPEGTEWTSLGRQ